jgi:ABC-type multidrug transport system ATPase subunit
MKNYYRNQRLEKSYGDNHVLNGFNMTLHEGENWLLWENQAQANL